MLFQETVSSLSCRALDWTEVQGKHACSQCLWIISRGTMGSAPATDVASLKDVIDRWVVRCIFYALEDDVSLSFAPEDDQLSCLKTVAFS